MSTQEELSYKSTCSYCGVGCGVIVNKDKKGEISLKGDPDHPVNKGMLCSKGMNLNYVVADDSDRLLQPQMRWGKSHPLEKVDWDTALERASAVFKSIIEKHGPDAVAFYVSGQCLTEEYYLVNKLTKGFLKTNNIDTNSRLCMSSAVMGYIKTLGEDSVPISYDDIELADCFFVAGANPAWCHPILWRRIEQHKEENPEVKIIVADPRATQSCSIADLHLQLHPGTDEVLFLAIGRCIIEQGDIDLAFIKNHTDGFDAYKDQVMKTTLEEASEICGVPIEDIKLAASYIGNAKAFLSLWTMGLNQSADGVNKNLALIDLNLITGHIGKPGSGPFSLTGQPNAMGGREVGGMATLLACHKNLGNPEHRKEVADFWGVDNISANPGKTATQIFEGIEDGSIKALWVICTNPLVSMPEARKVEKALKKARFVVVQDISNKNETIPYADLVLPAAGWGEKEGTMTNSERRISHLSPFKTPPGEALPDAEILIRFAKKMNFPGFDFSNMAEVYAEYCQLTKNTNIDISGLDYDYLKQQGTVQWPFLNKAQGGTKRLFTDHQFYTPNQRAQILTSGLKNSYEKPRPEFPLILTTGRIRDQWHTMTRTGKVNKLNSHIPSPFLEIHPDDAKERGIKEGDTVLVSGVRGEVRIHAQLTDKIKKGMVFMPMHWGKILGNDFARANNLTGNTMDPVSKQPDFKYSVVQVALYKTVKQKIVIIGAGAAAYRFINSYREFNQEDEIHVFSKEKHPFYNRVLLPDYVNAHKNWNDLLKFKSPAAMDKLNIKLFVENGIESIDRSNKTVTDEKGKVHHYGTLILATGSRAFVPPDAPMHLPGVFTMRNRENADDLKKYLNYKGHVLIAGGGLLGLELAAALREIDMKVTIVQLGSRLMERQLDPLASSLLRERLEEMGVQLFMNNQLSLLESHGDNKNITANLKSGQSIACNAVVYAIGTRPNIELGKSAGLICGRGLKVNDYLQTSDPDIFAMGEIAEHKGKLNGITAAAESQADTASRYITGDLLSSYKGSVPMNILKFADLDLCSIGIPEKPANAEGYEEILLIDSAQTYYKKCIVYKDRLVGAILMGDKSEFAEFKKLIEEKTELSSKRQELLRGSSSKEEVIGEVVCSCGQVGKGNLTKAIQSGCKEFRALCQQTGAGLGCGSCKPEVKEILDDALMVSIQV
ncbi:molybdopterin-dependent oxidoreductase [Cyclobacterium sp. 1_MG-2023]|uniref:nitrate reductase n=1 Tax=Cyclobacterium sp. 1_MG-2023 TaxID=3062681 RepID=UPI0026E12EC6|nr:nitrate reductase [Cyclobacterium sp. 1_MG-2023]MDO6439201.1 molybdopterin-dependent oxidoreductase [Cyclobacterium sp. 1_MG-2023]